MEKSFNFILPQNMWAVIKFTISLKHLVLYRAFPVAEMQKFKATLTHKNDENVENIYANS